MADFPSPSLSPSLCPTWKRAEKNSDGRNVTCLGKCPCRGQDGCQTTSNGACRQYGRSTSARYSRPGRRTEEGRGSVLRPPASHCYIGSLSWCEGGQGPGKPAATPSSYALRIPQTQCTRVSEPEERPEGPDEDRNAASALVRVKPFKVGLHMHLRRGKKSDVLALWSVCLYYVGYGSVANVRTYLHL